MLLLLIVVDVTSITIEAIYIYINYTTVDSSIVNVASTVDSSIVNVASTVNSNIVDVTSTVNSNIVEATSITIEAIYIYINYTTVDSSIIYIDMDIDWFYYC